MSASSPPTSRRSFLASTAAVLAAPSIAALAVGTLADPATAEAAAADTTYAPVPPSALGPALNEQGYYVGRVERNLYWVTDGVFQAAFLTTRDGVVLFDAPPAIGRNLQRAIDQIAAANGVSSKVTHLVHSHHHADHLSASSLFGRDVVRIGHTDNRRLLLRDNDPARPAPDITFQDRYDLRVGGESIHLSWHGSNHTPDNIYIHLPDHHALMLVDIAMPGWVPAANLNVAEDVPGVIVAPTVAMSYPWKHYIGGHFGRLGNRNDLVLHQQYIADIAAGARTAIAVIDQASYFIKHSPNILAGVKAYWDAVVDYVAAPVIAKYTGILAGADVFTTSHAFVIQESLRLDTGLAWPIHP